MILHELSVLKHYRGWGAVCRFKAGHFIRLGRLSYGVVRFTWFQHRGALCCRIYNLSAPKNDL